MKLAIVLSLAALVLALPQRGRGSPPFTSRLQIDMLTIAQVVAAEMVAAETVEAAAEIGTVVDETGIVAADRSAEAAAFSETSSKGLVKGLGKASGTA